MIKLKANIHGRQHDVRLLHNDDGLSARIDERLHEVKVSNPANEEYLISRGTSVYHCRVETSAKQPETFAVTVRGITYGIQLIDPKRSRGGQSAGEHGHGSAQIIAPMPGKVVRLMVEVGSQVVAGAGIVVVEAMKMQNEMKAPRAGVVVSLNAAPGATVNAGDVLAEIA
ncbi:MAG: biotin/lipoyl-containing protein [Pyrinomonadaceae bacterium]